MTRLPGDLAAATVAGADDPIFIEISLGAAEQCGGAEAATVFAADGETVVCRVSCDGVVPLVESP